MPIKRIDKTGGKAKEPKLINIGEDFTPEGLAALEIGQLLRFKDGESIREFRIVTMNKKQQVVMVREVKTYLDRELDEMFPEE